MAQTADQLRQDLDRKRRDLTRDMDRIEDRMKSTFDLSRQINERPLLATGLAIGAGFLLGSMVGGKRHPDDTQFESRRAYREYGRAYGHMADYGDARPADRYAYRPQMMEPSGPGLLSSVSAGMKESFRRGTGGRSFDDALGNMGAALMAVMVDKAKTMLDANLPGFADKYESVEQQQRTSNAEPAASSMSDEDGAPASRGPSDAAEMGRAGDSATYGGLATDRPLVSSTSSRPSPSH